MLNPVDELMEKVYSGLQWFKRQSPLKTSANVDSSSHLKSNFNFQSLLILRCQSHSFDFTTPTLFTCNTIAFANKFTGNLEICQRQHHRNVCFFHRISFPSSGLWISVKRVCFIIWFKMQEHTQISVTALTPVPLGTDRARKDKRNRETEMA